MKLDAEFIRLPLTFDAERMAEEVAQFSQQDWRGHPQDVGGNFRLPLIAAGGDPNDDEVKGEMAPTPHLERCEYLRQVLASFDTVLGRTRLMRIDGNAQATMHVDDNYYWVDRVRVHVPIVTRPEIEFVCGENTVHMPAGEAWLFDTWRMHNALNPTGERRIHLVADTVGSEGFWRLVESGERPFVEGGDPAPSERVPYDPGASAEVETERSNFPVVMTPGEQERLAESLLEDLDPTSDAGATESLRSALLDFLRSWESAWERYGTSDAGFPAYRELLQALEHSLAPLDGELRLANGTDAAKIAGRWLVEPALNPELTAVEA